MASEVEIANAALQKLGAARIVDLTDNSVAARACNNCYERLRDKELRAHRWNFAISRAQLAASTTSPAFGPAYAYPLPADFLRLAPLDPENIAGSGLSIPGTIVTFGASMDWRIENHLDGRAILSNEGAPLNIRYVAIVTDPNLMDALFREALACRMAEEMCEEITQSNVKKADARTDYKAAIQEAKLTNALENVPEQSADSSWVTSRA